MKRSASLVEVSRREFCTIAGLTVFIAACTDGNGAVGTGPLTGSDDSAPDASSHETVDASVSGGHDAAVHDAAVHDAGSSQPPTDGSVGATCGTSAVDVGAASTFVTGTPVYVSSGKFFVVRDSGGLYAVTAVCTHEGATCVVSSGEFRCPRHGALFTFNGAVVSGPVSRALVHYALCELANGHIGVTTSTQVSATTRFAA